MSEAREVTAKPYNYLVETCLLSHGLRAVPDEDIYDAFSRTSAHFAWIQRGKICLGDTDAFLKFRARRVELRANRENLDIYCREEADAALTASGVMEICIRNGIDMAVTCGMGGIDISDNKRISSDLRALRDLPVALLATSVKDVLDIPQSMKWLRNHGVKILGHGTERCSGYVLKSCCEQLDGTFGTGEFPAIREEIIRLGRGMLLLNPIEDGKRIEDNGILRSAIDAGKAAACRGEYFHPAANARLDELSKSRTSYLQLESLKENVLLADKMTCEESGRK